MKAKTNTWSQDQVSFAQDIKVVALEQRLNCPTSSLHCSHPLPVNTQKESHTRDPNFYRIVLLFHNLRYRVVL